MSAPLRIATAATRSWVGADTAGMPSERGAASRTEIESDLWEHVQAASEDGEGLLSTAREVLGGVTRGMPSDLLWRFQKGGWEMQSTFVIERSTDVIMLLIILFGIASFAGGHGTDSGEPYCSQDFPTFARNLGDHTRQLIFQFALATALIPAPACCTSRSAARGAASPPQGRSRSSLRVRSSSEARSRAFASTRWRECGGTVGPPAIVSGSRLGMRRASQAPSPSWLLLRGTRPPAGPPAGAG